MEVRPLHFGVTIPNNFGVKNAKDLATLAADAEALGYQSVWVSEHLMHATYVEQRLGDKPYHEALTILTACAMTTSTVQLGTSVLVLPWHHPARLAKSVASLDSLSDGRVILGVGVAITEDEYESLGIPFRERGKIADETLDAMKALWTQEVPEYNGNYYAFKGLRFEPKPVTQPYPPIWIGGASPAAMRRVVRIGDGWHPLGMSPRALAEAKQELDEMMRAAGRDPSGLPLTVRLGVDFRDEPWDRPVEDRRTARGTPEEIRALMAAYAAAGVTHIIVDPASGDLENTRDIWKRFKDEIIDA